MKEYTNLIKNGIIDSNPTLVLLLGMCSTMAVSTTVQNGVGMGLSVTAVLICSNAVISLLRKIIPAKIRIAAFVVVIAAFVTIVDLLLQAYVPALSESLGLFIPLIVVNCIILARAEAFASKNDVLSSMADGLGMGLGFTLAITVVSIIRELLGNGTIWGVRILSEAYQPALLIIMPCGGFLTLGCVIAFVQWMQSRKKEAEK